ncbi:MAG: hypothetical protein ACR2IV_15125 [Bryobacteraceae bacterium]
MPVLVGDRQIHIYTKGTQTVKICTPRNELGVYEKCYRIEPPYVLEQALMEDTIADFTTPADLEQWLIEDRTAVRETENEASPPPVSGASAGEEKSETSLETPRSEPTSAAGAVAEVLNLLRSGTYAPDNDPWLLQARDTVETAINRFVEEFLQSPYLHRVEHSIRAHLFHLLASEQMLAVQVPIGAGLAKTQLIHQEWPERTVPEGKLKGTFDLALLSPNLLETCASVEVFREGRLQAPIVIETGLDCDAEHLAEHAKKLMNSRPWRGYLIHLGREMPREPEAEEILLALESKLGIKTVYCWVAGSHKTIKRLGEKTITHATTAPPNK